MRRRTNSRTGGECALDRRAYVGVRPAARPDKLTGPASTDREVTELTGFVSDGKCRLPARRGLGTLRHHRSGLGGTGPAGGLRVRLRAGLSLGPGEQAQFVCAGDTAFGPDEVLPHADSIKAGILRCESADSGIACRDIRTGHGFSISPEVYRLF